MELEFIHQEQTLKEGITHLDEIRIRLKPCGDLDGGSDEMTKEIELRKRKDGKHLELEFIHQEQTPKEGIT